MASLNICDGMSVLFDDCDAHLVAAVHWVGAPVGRKTGGYYAIGWCKNLKRSVYMHRVIAGAQQGQFVDHINGNTLDNTRGNLRLCSPTQNCGNSRYPVGASGYRGVERYNKTEKWRACISIGGKRVQLGVADNAEDAARIYDIAAIRHFGEFATLNFPKMVA